ncbi:DUF4199 domain-containing protein [Flavobacterium sp. C4GT6]|uniref:DUF4199 domain-containing protein n=1 Tax=Flavobacterium sp. C4GT6 TaxID=3103818 RepID=UPI002ED16A01
MKEAIKKNGVNFGIILGILLIALITIQYTVDINLFVNPWINIIKMILFIVLGIIAIAKAKVALKGFISFKEAFTAYFLTIVIGSLGSTLFVILLFNVIDPSAKTTVMDLIIESTAKTLQSFGSSTEDIKKMVDEMEKADSFGVASQLKGLAISILGYSVVGLICAAAFKKNTTHEQ